MMIVVAEALSLCIYTTRDNEVKDWALCFDVTAVGGEKGSGEGWNQSHSVSGYS
jgi:hypothetical protein